LRYYYLFFQRDLIISVNMYILGANMSILVVKYILCANMYILGANKYIFIIISFI